MGYSMPQAPCLLPASLPGAAILKAVDNFVKNQSRSAGALAKSPVYNNFNSLF